MANRAYLYPSHAVEFGRWRAEPPYYDSRHSIPIGWFFFFARPDVLTVSCDGWEELKLAAEKGPALKRFVARRHLLQPYLEGELLTREADEMVSNLARWPGEFLLMEPSEVIDSNDDVHKASYEAILSQLDALQPDPAQLDALLRHYSGDLSHHPDKRLCQVLGFTYTWGI